MKNIVQNDSKSIFKFINGNENTSLSEMKGIYIQELLFLLDDYLIELRDNLYIDESITFGLELEVENTDYFRIKKMLQDSNYEWELEADSSLVKGAEIKSPILNDKTKNWFDLKNICEKTSELASIGEKAGGHIHIGYKILGEKEQNWLNLIKLWSIYENIIFRFSYGEFNMQRPSLTRYAAPISKKLVKDYYLLKNSKSDVDEILFHLCNKYDKYCAINFQNVYIGNNNRTKNTIEIRCPNGTLNPIIWQNNVNFFIKLLNYCKSDFFDDYTIEKRSRIINGKYQSLNFYNEIYIDQVLELSDMIFSNNLDKINFLKQYFKSFETEPKYSKVKCLTK